MSPMRGGKVRSFHIEGPDRENVVPIVRANIARKSKLATDEGSHYMFNLPAKSPQYLSTGVMRFDS